MAEHHTGVHCAALRAVAGALTEPAKAGVFVSDFLTLTRPTSAAAPFSAYLAQMNLLALPRQCMC